MTTGKFTDKVNAFAARARRAQLEVFKQAVLEVGERVIDTTPRLTGRAQGSWETAVGAPAAGPAPDRDPEAAKAELRAAVAELKPGDVVFITSSLFYIRMLEYGTSRNGPRGMVGLTAQDWSAIVAEAVSKVRG